MMRSAVSNSMFHPAVAQLHKFQIQSRWQAFLARVRSPRRRGLVLLSVILALVWLGQATAGVLLREPADPTHVRFWIPAAMFIYCLYHLVKTLTRTPESPFEWTSAETELLLGAPLTRLQVIAWRLRVIFTAAVAKAACFAVVMSPDVPSVPLAMIGMLGALLMIDFFRLIVSIAVDALTERERWLCRVAFVFPLIAIVMWSMFCCLTTISRNSSPAQFSVGLILNSSSVLLGLLRAEPFSMFLEPFRLFTAIVFAEEALPQILVYAIGAIGLLGGSLLTVVMLDKICRERNRRLELETWELNKGRNSPGLTTRSKIVLSSRNINAPWFLAGAGPIAWRQLLGAWHYRNTVRFSLLIPTLLCCLPMFTDANKAMMIMSIGGSLVFYTFLLLPSGLILDYRRDIDRMVVLKSLPISPWAITAGQLATPVLLASMFQAVVLGIGVVTNSITIFQAAVAFVVLLPFNILNFALENFLFMLSPYRRNEEGVMVFVRTILTFTAKGILFGIAFAVVFGWVLLSFGWANRAGLGPWAGSAVFATGIWILIGAAAFVFASLLTKRIKTFDVSIDSPAG